MHFWAIKNLSNDLAVRKTQPEFKFKQCIANGIKPPEFPRWTQCHGMSNTPASLPGLANKDVSVFFLMLMLKSNAFHKPFEPNGDFFHQSVYLNPTHVLSCCSSALSELGEHAFIREELGMKRCEIETCTALDLQSTALYRDIYQASFCRRI